MLRHTVATLAYRAAKTLRGAPADFGAFRPSPDSRSAGEVLAHMCDLFDWALSIAEARTAWRDSHPQSWDEDVRRFFDALERLDRRLETAAPDDALARQLFQGPIADAIQHTGQLAMLRRLAGAPIKGENYFAADIVEGRVGANQAGPRREF